MKKIIIILLIVVALIISGFLFFYLTNKNSNNENFVYNNLTNINLFSVVKQGLYGKVTIISGNCMPTISFKGSSGSSSCKTLPASVILYIREPAYYSKADGMFPKEKTKLIKQVQSNQDGYYEVELPKGTYSVFYDNNGKEDPRVTGADGLLGGVTVGKGKTEFNIQINQAVW